MKSFLGLSLIILSFFFLVHLLKINSSLPLNPVQDTQSLLSLETIDHKIVSSLSLNTKRLLHFYASWCQPCQKELPSLLKYIHQHQELKLVLLCLDDCPRIPNAEIFYLPKSISITIPQSVYIDEQNTVIWSHKGAYSWDKANFL